MIRCRFKIIYRIVSWGKLYSMSVYGKHTDYVGDPVLKKYLKKADL